MTQPPSLAQGRWNHLSQFSSQHMMVAPVCPQTQQCCQEPSSSISSSLGASPGSPTAPGRAQDVATVGSQPTEPLWSCWEPDFVPQPAGWLASHTGLSFLGSGLSSGKPRLAQISLLLPGSHLLCCPPDCKLDISRQKAQESNMFIVLPKKQGGKKLQKRGEADEERAAGIAHCNTAGSAWNHSPGRTRGHRA